MSDPRNIPMGKRAPITNWAVDDLTARDAIRYRYVGAQLSELDVGSVCRVGTVAPFAYYVLESASPLAWSPLGGVGVDFGTTSGTACEGDDSRLGDARQLAAGEDKTKLDELPDGETLAADLAEKADAAATEASLAGKADSAATTAALASKASVDVENGFKKSGARTLTESGPAIGNDVGAAVDMNAAGANDFTIPHGIGEVDEAITVLYRGAGLGTIVQGSNVEVRPPPGRTLVTLGQWSWVQLVKRVSDATDIWMVTGDLEEEA